MSNPKYKNPFDPERVSASYNHIRNSGRKEFARELMLIGYDEDWEQLAIDKIKRELKEGE